MFKWKLNKQIMFVLESRWDDKEPVVDNIFDNTLLFVFEEAWNHIYNFNPHPRLNGLIF